MGATQSKSDDTINWNNLNTNDISSTMPNNVKISYEAKQLIESLNVPNNIGYDTETKPDEMVAKILGGNNESETLSDSSPFISSEMYNQIVKNNNTQKGGAKKSKKVIKTKKSAKNMKTKKSTKNMKSKKGGAVEDDDSSTSSTSSDSELEDIIDDDSEDDIKKDDKKKDDKKKDDKKKDDSSESDENLDSEENSEMSGGELSYLSSSAHTEGLFSDEKSNEKSDEKSDDDSNSDSDSDSKSNSDSNSDDESSVSKDTVTDENKEMFSTSNSINTSDINMISDN